jgi:ABC-2 type transport system ATP-binding protein
VLILDEPTSGLDPMERIRFRDLIGQLGEERTVLLSMHIVSDIEAIAKEVFLMKQGRIISQGSIAALCDEISGKSWICRSDKKEAMEVINRQDTLVVTMRSEGSSMEYRILCGDKPCENAMPSEVTLEDVFIYHFGESEDRGNAQI